jgi:hypothetical protein
MSGILIFTCEGRDHEIELVSGPGSATLSQHEDWLPAEAARDLHIPWLSANEATKAALAQRAPKQKESP